MKVRMILTVDEMVGQKHEYNAKWGSVRSKNLKKVERLSDVILCLLSRLSPHSKVPRIIAFNTSNCFVSVGSSLSCSLLDLAS